MQKHVLSRVPNDVYDAILSTQTVTFLTYFVAGLLRHFHDICYVEGSSYLRCSFPQQNTHYEHLILENITLFVAFLKGEVLFDLIFKSTYNLTVSYATIEKCNA